MRKRIKVKRKISPKYNKKERIEKVTKELQILLPFPTPSRVYLAQAIAQGARVFLTSDPLIYQHRDILESKFKVLISDDYMEATDIAKHGRRRDGFELMENVDG
jgi:hypothetical protein